MEFTARAYLLPLEAASVSGGTVADAMSGIIAIDASASAVTLTAIDPSTSMTTATHTFQGPQGVLPRVNMASSYIAQQGFSTNLDRVGATMTVAADNSNHVGWVTNSGLFVDVPEAVVTAQSNFSAPPRTSHPYSARTGRSTTSTQYRRSQTHPRQRHHRGRRRGQHA